MRHVELTDVIVATVLPFDDDGGIDWDSYRRLLDYCALPDGMGAVFVNGHAGEGAALTREERIRVIETTRAYIGPSRLLLAGVIPYCTSEAVEQARGREGARGRRRGAVSHPELCRGRCRHRGPGRLRPHRGGGSGHSRLHLPVRAGIGLRLSDGDAHAHRRVARRRRHQGRQRHDDRIRGQLPAPQGRGAARRHAPLQLRLVPSAVRGGGRMESCQGSRTSRRISWWTSGGRRRASTSAPCATPPTGSTPSCAQSTAPRRAWTCTRESRRGSSTWGSSTAPCPALPCCPSPRRWPPESCARSTRPISLDSSGARRLWREPRSRRDYCSGVLAGVSAPSRWLRWRSARGMWQRMECPSRVSCHGGVVRPAAEELVDQPESGIADRQTGKLENGFAGMPVGSFTCGCVPGGLAAVHRKARGLLEEVAPDPLAGRNRIQVGPVRPAAVDRQHAPIGECARRSGFARRRRNAVESGGQSKVPHRGQRQGALPRAALPHEADGLPPACLEIAVSENFEGRATPAAKSDAEVADFDERRLGHVRPAPSAPDRFRVPWRTRRPIDSRR